VCPCLNNLDCSTELSSLWIRGLVLPLEGSGKAIMRVWSADDGINVFYLSHTNSEFSVNLKSFCILTGGFRYTASQPVTMKYSVSTRMAFCSLLLRFLSVPPSVVGGRINKSNSFCQILLAMSLSTNLMQQNQPGQFMLDLN